MADMPLVSNQQGGTNQLSGIAQLLQSLNGLSGTGKTTTTNSSSTDPSTNDAIDQLLASINGGTSDATMDGIIQNIFNQGKQALGANLFQGAGGGAYNSTTQQQLAGETLSKTVAAAAQAKLQAQQQGQETAAKVLAAKANANRTTTQVSQTKASPFASMLGPAVGALSLYNKLTGDVKSKNGGILNTLKDKLLGPKDLGDGAIKSTVDSSGAAGNDVGFDAFGNATTNSDATSSLPDLSTASGDLAVGGSSDLSTALSSADLLDASLVGGESALTSSAAGADIFGGAVSDGAVGDAASGALGSEVGADVGLVGGAEAGADIGLAAGGEAAFDGAAAAGALEGGAAAAEAAEGFELADLAVVASAVICSESVKQGLMKQELYNSERLVAQKRLTTTHIQGYHILALPLVIKMRKDKKFAEKMAKLANAYAEFLVNGKTSWRSKLLTILGEPLCYIVGKLCKSVDYKTLYQNKGA